MSALDKAEMAFRMMTEDHSPLEYFFSITGGGWLGVRHKETGVSQVLVTVDQCLDESGVRRAPEEVDRMRAALQAA